MKILAAEHVLPISSEPIADGAVAMDADVIVALGIREEITSRFAGVEIQDFGRAAILPGLINCHAHLEVTSMRGALDAVEHDFRSWLLKLNDIRSGLSDADIEAAAILGAKEAATAGVTCIGDIGRCGDAGLSALKKVGLRGVLFQETEFSPDNSTADDDFARLKEKYTALREKGADLVEVGLSPHSPYTVSRRLFELIAKFAIDENIKLTIHVAESVEEDALLGRGEGFFMKFYERVGANWEVPHSSSIEFLSRTGVLAARPLLAHCVTVSDSDIDLLAESGSTIAHCPKSNAKFGHGYAPLEKFLKAGISVGLGSDSVASNNVCDLFEESRFAAFVARNQPARRGFMSARQVLELATIGGARAIGLEEKIGSLEAGKQADIAVVSLDGLSQMPVSDVEAALVFSSNASDVSTTFVAGSTIYSR